MIRIENFKECLPAQVHYCPPQVLLLTHGPTMEHFNPLFDGWLVASTRSSQRPSMRWVPLGWGHFDGFLSSWFYYKGQAKPAYLVGLSINFSFPRLSLISKVVHFIIKAERRKKNISAACTDSRKKSSGGFFPQLTKRSWGNCHRYLC